MKSKTKKNIVAGLGEIGLPICKLLSKNSITVGYDIDKKLMNQKLYEKYKQNPTLILNICIPFSKKFIANVQKLEKFFEPEIIVIHSTISPNTTSLLQSKLKIPVIYSATRGVHKRMQYDLKRYTKFFAISSKTPRRQFAIKEFKKIMKLSGIKTKQMTKPETLELGKIICDTSYLGWLINYSQISNVIAKKYGVNYDEMWEFSDEIHKFLGNRPKMYPGHIGGHCVIPNLDLMHNETLNLIKKMNTSYSKKIKNSKSIHKKYIKNN